MSITDKSALFKLVEKEVNSAEITDLHTHLYPAAFGELMLWGIDDLLTYHFLVAEYFRYSEMDYDDFFALDRREQADLIWQKLFIEHSPVSEVQRGVLTVLSSLGLDVAGRDLPGYRKYFESMTAGEYVNKVFELSKVREVIMTNDPFDPVEKALWDGGGHHDPRFKAALRIDPLLNEYRETHRQLITWGYAVKEDLSRDSVEEIRRFLRDWAGKMDAGYMAVSLPPTFVVPETTLRSRLIEDCVLPVCRELNLPLALMIGVKKMVNRGLGLAGDSIGKSRIEVLEYLCTVYPHNKFLVTMLSRENQHELAVVARKFRNLMVFGCWWFLNNPSLVEEITRMRLETLGLSFIPQHSDARVLDQLVYKWAHFRKIVTKVLVDKYSDILDNGWSIEPEEITRDVGDLFGRNFRSFVGRRL